MSEVRIDILHTNEIKHIELCSEYGDFSLNSLLLEETLEFMLKSLTFNFRFGELEQSLHYCC